MDLNLTTSRSQGQTFCYGITVPVNEQMEWTWRPETPEALQVRCRPFVRNLRVVGESGIVKIWKRDSSPRAVTSLELYTLFPNTP
uniref:SFRICE_038306 n=1 Tax=Spodoptera frugiperda TaxID=7108 RepID=A0A2H1W8G8_SPOFR